MIKKQSLIIPILLTNVKKKTKIFFYVLLILLLANFVYSIYGVSGNNYEIIRNDNELTDFFSELKKENLIFTSAFGNEIEQLFFYKYLDNVELIVYKIDGYKDVNLDSIHLFLIDNIKDVEFNPKRFLDFGRIKLTSKYSKLTAKQLIILSKHGSNLIKHFENDSSAYVSIISNGIILAESIENPNIRYSSEQVLVYNIYLKKMQNSMFIFVLSFNNRYAINENMLLELVD